MPEEPSIILEPSPTEAAAVRPGALGRGPGGLWALRLYYFFWIGGNGFLLPFLNLFFRRRGLRGTEIGMLLTASAVAALLAAPMWGRWSDRVRRPERLLQAALVGTALALLGLSQQRVFGWLALVMTLQTLMAAGIEPLSNALAMRLTQERGSGFGSVRVWGSLGWAIIVVFSGWLIERTGLTAAFAGNALSLLVGCAILGTVALPAAATVGPIAGPRGLRQVARALARDRAMLGLGAALSVMWLSNLGQKQFEPIYLDQLGAGETLIGLASMIGAVVELPMMFWADRLVRRLGPHPVLQAALLLNASAEALVLAAPSIASIAVLRAVGGVSFSFYTVALVVFVNARAPGRQQATAQALYAVTLSQLIQIVGAPLAGLAFDALGAYWLYALGLGGNLLAWLILRLSPPAP